MARKVELTSDETLDMLTAYRYGRVGKGKVSHLIKADESVCGKIVGEYLSAAESSEMSPCKRCWSSAERQYDEARQIAYGAMRDAELDRMTWGGSHYSAEEEAADIAAYLPGARKIVEMGNTDIVILTPEGPVEGTSENIAAAIEAVASPVMADWEREINLSAAPTCLIVGVQTRQGGYRGTDCMSDLTDYARLVYSSQEDAQKLCEYCGESLLTCDMRPDVDGPMTGQYDDYDYSADAPDMYAVGEALGNSLPVIVPCDVRPDMEDTMQSPMIVEAKLMITISEGVTMDLGWHFFEIMPGDERSIPTLYGQEHGEWKNGEANWDSLITVADSYVAQ